MIRRLVRLPPALAAALLLGACGGAPDALEGPNDPSHVAADPATTGAATVTWADATSSPHPLPARDVDDDLAPMFAHCGAPDAALTRVAERVAAHKIATGNGPTEDRIDAELRAAGEPHVWPRTWVVSGSELTDATLLPKLDAWRAAWRTFGQVRCGIARKKGAVAVVAVDALADLSPLPIATHAGTWLSIEASIGVASSGADIVVARINAADNGTPLHLPTSFDGARARARFAPDRPGAFLVQVIAKLPEGPRPVLEARVYADVAPPESLDVETAAPGESAGTSASAADALVQMITALRSDANLPPVTRDPALDKLAEAHSRRMLARLMTAHDAGDGEPDARVRAAGLDVHSVGENVAHAATAKEAHRALYESPSHRAVLLAKNLKNVGVAAIAGPDGTLWVTELFTGP